MLIIIIGIGQKFQMSMRELVIKCKQNTIEKCKWTNIVEAYVLLFPQLQFYNIKQAYTWFCLTYKD